jgi:RNAse (barnase) inhibitor barstar
MNAQPLQALLVEPDQAGTFYLTASDLGPLQDAAQDVGFLCIPLDLSGCSDKAGLMRAFAAAFGFPDWFGHNWDALADCLGDLDWLPAEGYVLGLRNVQRLRAADPADYATLIAVLEGVCEDWRERGTPFWAFIALPDDQFDALPS